GGHLAFTNTRQTAIELWMADTATGQARLFSGSDRINATPADPCDWLDDSTAIVCTIVPGSRGPAPVEPRVPSGPNVLETSGKAAPARTFEDLIKTRFAEDVFEYYFTSQLASYDLRTGRRTDIGRPGILAAVS